MEEQKGKERVGAGICSNLSEGALGGEHVLHKAHMDILRGDIIEQNAGFGVAWGFFCCRSCRGLCRQ
jgi:hypothetical protein